MMNPHQYRQGIRFIKKTSGCEGEKKARIKYFREHAKKLVGAKPPKKPPYEGIL